MSELAARVKEALTYYWQGGGHQIQLFGVTDEAQRVYAALVVDTQPQRRPPAIIVMVRIEGDYVIVEADNTDRPVIERLVAVGIARENIIATYVGEQLPTPPPPAPQVLVPPELDYVLSKALALGPVERLAVIQELAASLQRDVGRFAPE